MLSELSNAELVQILLRTVLIAGIFLAGWIAFSVPGALLYAALKAVVAPAISGLERMRAGLHAFYSGFNSRVGSLLERIGAKENFTLYVDQAIDEFEKKLRKVVGNARRGSQRAIQASGYLAGAITDMNKKIENLTKRLEDVSRAAAPARQDRRRGGAVAGLVFITPFLLFAVVLNTTLLNLFFRELISLRVFGLPVAILIALLYTLIEAMVGFFIAWFRTRSPIVSRFLIFIAPVLIGVEVFLYGILSAAIDWPFPPEWSQAVPVIDYWLALMGLLIGVMLIVLGYAFDVALSEVTSGHNPGAVLRRLENRLGQAEGRLRRFQDDVTDDEVADVVKALATAQDELTKAIRKTVSADVEPEVEVSSSRAGFLDALQSPAIAIIGAIIFAFSVWFMGTKLAQSDLPILNQPLAAFLVAGALQCALLFAGSQLLQQRVRLVRANDKQKVQVHGPNLPAALIAWAAVFAVMGASVWVSLFSGLGMDFQGLLQLIAVNFATLGIGRVLTRVVAGFAFLFMLVVNLIAIVAVVVFWSLSWLVQILLSILRGAAEIIGAPTLLVWRFFARGNPA